MTTQPITLAMLRRALAEGWRIASATRGVSIAYALVFVLGGVLIMGGLLAQGWAPFVLAAAGAFMLVGPVILAGFFGIAQAFEAGSAPGAGAIIAGFRNRLITRLGAGAGLRVAVHDFCYRCGHSLCLHGGWNPGLVD
jgi:hypothetical protein